MRVDMRWLSTDNIDAIWQGLPVNPRIVTQGSFGTPKELLALIDANIERYRLFVVNALPGIPRRDGVHFETVFIGPGMRGAPQLDYYPSRLSVAPRLFFGPLVPDLVVINVSRPINGRVSLGIEVQVMPGALEAVRKTGGRVVAQINEDMPFVHGDGVLSLDDIDFGVEIASAPVAARAGASQEADELGRFVASLVVDGATLQAGIGAVPDSALAALRNHKGLRIWSELLSEGFRELFLAGALDEHPITGSFAYGTNEFYEWIDDNEQIVLLRCDYTNNPGVIAGQRMMTSINTALQVDLFGQANASRINDTIFSGTGGQTDFFVGAVHSLHGKPIMALKSWHPKADVSTIVAKLESATTSSQFSYTVTEHGIAPIFGASQEGQALGLISIADPRAREKLRFDAERMGLVSA